MSLAGINESVVRLYTYSDDKFGAIDPAGESRSDTFFERRRSNPWLSLKFADNLTIDIPVLFAKRTFSFLLARDRIVARR